jgi:hypothetical protein
MRGRYVDQQRTVARSVEVRVCTDIEGNAMSLVPRQLQKTISL